MPRLTCTRATALVPTLFLVLAGTTAAGEPAAGGLPAPPWKESIHMELRGKDRSFARYRDTDWLRIEVSELKDRAFVAGKEVLFLAKVERVGRGAAKVLRLYGIPEDFPADPERWGSRLEADNCWVFARVGSVAGAPLQIVAVEPAPSDRQVVNARNAGIAVADWPARLAAARWVRGQAAVQGNREWWQVAADDLVIQVVEDATATAAKARDHELLDQAIGWCTDVLRDPGRAARIASAAWVRESAAANEAIAGHMKRLDMSFYLDRWLPRSEALTQEFEDRFAAIDWRNAEGFYRLGRWADGLGDQLPLDKDRIHRCYQAGLKANPNHPGIRRELGLPAVAAQAGAAVASSGGPPVNPNDLTDAESGAVVRCPEAWNPDPNAREGVAWADPAAPTSTITAYLVPAIAGSTLESMWGMALPRIQAKPGFASRATEETTAAVGTARRTIYSWTEENQPRVGEMVLVVNPGAKVALRLEVTFAEENQAKVREVVSQMLGRLLLPIPAGEAPARSTQNLPPTQTPTGATSISGVGPGMPPGAGQPPTGLTPPGPGMPGMAPPDSLPPNGLPGSGIPGSMPPPTGAMPGFGPPGVTPPVGAMPGFTPPAPPVGAMPGFTQPPGTTAPGSTPTTGGSTPDGRPLPPNPVVPPPVPAPGN